MSLHEKVEGVIWVSSNDASYASPNQENKEEVIDKVIKEVANAYRNGKKVGFH
ncbi:hypothetical protein PAAL109150_17850 [Paenibacillus alkaliterrae]